MSADPGIERAGRSRMQAMARRGGWTLADQVLSSASNLALGILVARLVDIHHFAAFSVAYTIYMVAVGASRALVSEPLVVRHSDSKASVLSDAIAGSTGSAFVLGCLLGLLAIAGGAMIGGLVGEALIPLGLLLPGLLLQDAWRYAFFAAAAPGRAALNDAVWGIAQVGLVAAVAIWSSPGTGSLVMAWAAAGGIAALFGCLQAGRGPNLRGAWRWLNEHRDLGPPFLGWFALSVAGQQITMLIIGTVAGLEAVGALRSGQLVLSPLRLLLFSLPLMAVPEAVRLRAPGERALMKATVAVSAVSVLAALLYGAVILMLPNSLGTAVLSRQWAPGRSLLAPLLVGWLAFAAASGALVGLRALAAVRPLLSVSIVGAVLGLAAGTVGAATDGARGGTWGLSLATAFGAVLLWIQFLRSRRATLGLRGHTETPVHTSLDKQAQPV